jgi:uncharacterized membrane protein
VRDEKHHAWLHAQLPEWAKEGWISPESVARLRDRYPVGIGGGRALMLALGSILGALLVGGGVILLLAHNWGFMPRPVRAVVAFVPVLAGQALAAWALWRAPESRPWREGVGLSLALAMGACIALVGQTYHVTTSFAGFVFAWMLVILPAVYLLDAVAAAAFYLIGIVFWSGTVMPPYGTVSAAPCGYWLLLAAIVPWVVRLFRRDGSGVGASWLAWVLVVTVAVGMGLTYPRWMHFEEGLVVRFVLLAGVCCAVSRRGGAWSPLFLPARVVGLLGVVGFSLFFTYEFLSRRLFHLDGFGAGPAGSHPGVWVSIGVEGLLYLVGLFTAGVAAVRAVRERCASDALCLAFPVLTFACMLGPVGDAEAIAAVVFNLFLLALGVVTLVEGWRGGRLAGVNIGFLILVALFTARFFDVDFPFVVRGVVFVVIGAAFLFLNQRLAKRWKGGAT